MSDLQRGFGPPRMPEGPPTLPSTPPPMTGQGSYLPTTVEGELTPDERTLGMLVHLLAIFTGFLGVLILWLVKKDESRFIDFHGKEAINFQLTVMLVAFGSMLVGMVTIVGIFVAIPLVWGLGIAAFVVEIMACMAANRGEWFRYPMCIRFIKD